MAWAFDETSGHNVTAADNAALTLEGSTIGFTVAGWLYLDDNTGSFYQYFLSWGVYNATPSFQMYIGEATGPASVNDVTVRCYEAAGAGGAPWIITGTSNPAATTGRWMHVAVVSNPTGTLATLYIDGVADGTASTNLVSEVDVAAVMYFGMREDNDADRRLGGKMAGWAKWTGPSTVAEIQALAAGLPPYLLRKPSWYVPMRNSYRDWDGTLTLTNNSSTLSADHPPIWTPTRHWTPQTTVAAAAAGGHPAVKRFGGIPFAARMAGAGSPRGVQIW